MDTLFKLLFFGFVVFLIFDSMPRIYHYLTGRTTQDILIDNKDELAHRCATARTPSGQDMWCGLLYETVQPAAGPKKAEQDYPARPYRLTRERQ
jgi:hypothetical protein